MNKQKIITGTSVFILLVLFVVAPDAQAQDDIRGFSSSNFKTSNLNTGDGIIDEGWVDVAQQDLSTAFGEGGYAKFANNATHLFTLLRATTSHSWLSIEFDYDPAGCMGSQHDGWAIYIDGSTVEARDILFDGTIMPTTDSQNDLVAEAVVTGGLIDIEIVRPFSTGDTVGADIEIANETLTFITFASDADHFGARENFYLSIKYYDLPEGAAIPVDAALSLDIPITFDWNPIKKNILLGAVIFVGVFMHVHYSIRVIHRPLNHGSRIVDSNHNAPKVLDRLTEFKENNYENGDEN